MTDCACVDVYTEDGDSALISNTEIRVARKVHRCGECRRDILAGESYEYIRQLFADGEWFTSRICTDCLSVLSAMFCGGWIYGEVWLDVEEHVIDCYDQIGEAIITQLTPRAREKLCDMIQERWEELDDE